MSFRAGNERLQLQRQTRGPGRIVLPFRVDVVHRKGEPIEARVVDWEPMPLGSVAPATVDEQALPVQGGMV